MRLTVSTAARHELQATLGDPYTLGQVLDKATALALTGLAVSVALDAGLSNIAGEALRGGDARSALGAMMTGAEVAV